MNNLVEIKNGKPLTSSLIVAEKFEKNHKDVLKAIQKLGCSPEFWRRNFAPSVYTDPRGKSQPFFVITESGFSFLAMGFTGEKADAFKEEYIKAFVTMREALTRQQNEDWKENRLNGKQARRELTDTIQNFIDYAKAQGSSNAGFYYANITKMTYKCLALLEKGSKVGPKFRDLLNSSDITFLGGAEYIAQEAIQTGIDEGMHYKGIYEYAKNKVEAYSSLVLPTLSAKRLRA